MSRMSRFLLFPGASILLFVLWATPAFAGSVGNGQVTSAAVTMQPPMAAALVNVAVPDNAFLHDFEAMGLDVVWAAPCRPIDPSCGAVDLSFQGGFGWRLATPAEAAALNAVLVGADFIFPGANVPLGGADPNGAIIQAGPPPGDAACAAPYFSPFHFHCDWGNTPGANLGFQEGWAFGQPGELDFGEAILVRDTVRVPEPATLALLGLGILVLGAGLRRRA